MVAQAYSLRDAAAAMGVSTRQVRRYIVQGKLKAELVPGKFGEEYRILEIPPDLIKNRAPSAAAPDAALAMANEMVRTLQEENLRLAGQLGAATERIRSLEQQLRLLAPPKKEPWWRRFFRRTASGNPAGASPS